jgi:hypothetical protein
VQRCSKNGGYMGKKYSCAYGTPNQVTPPQTGPQKREFPHMLPVFAAPLHRRRYTLRERSTIGVCKAKFRGVRPQVRNKKANRSTPQSPV